jgi:hypothetical protein
VGVDSTKARSGRPPKLSEEQLEELKKIIAEDNQRVWVARHVYILIISVFGLIFSVRYIPELLRSIVTAQIPPLSLRLRSARRVVRCAWSNDANF